ncbi:endonuclease domain-containing protein [Beijerinckia sp. L45]|uniref:endonuclease domain-containing protein n=1 Tax=Beijerinckia sp. L45 TaxID=1641855 RepID=UPI001FF05E01|nr:DUF559 domain-containing protein [Beijerinckia sp. L45]
MLQLDLLASETANAAVNQILDDLAALALALWPDWYGGGDGTIDTGVLQPWRRAAKRLADSGRPPRFRRTHPQIEFTQLLRAIDPVGLVLLASLDVARPRHAAPMIAALEWCAAQGASIVILCPSRSDPAPPFERILYGALDVLQPAAPVLNRLIVPKGKAHHASQTEARIQAALQRDTELGPLFAYNRCVMTNAPGFSPRVDLVWAEGRIVVELDGPEHQGDPKYGDDRHRDYELLVAGYLVLRLTNAQVATDLQLAVEKIRRVVRLRRSEGDYHA